MPNADLTTAEAGARLGLHPSSVCRYCKSGQLRATWHVEGGGYWTVAVADCDEFATRPRKPGPRPAREAAPRN